MRETSSPQSNVSRGGRTDSSAEDQKAFCRLNDGVRGLIQRPLDVWLRCQFLNDLFEEAVESSGVLQHDKVPHP